MVFCLAEVRMISADLPVNVPKAPGVLTRTLIN
jgi:hypothetical protein